MSTETRSKFTAFLNPKATAENRLPNVTGQFALQDGQTYQFSAWAGRSTKGTLYMKGTHAPQQLAEALKAQIESSASIAPSPTGMDLKPGEIILFENLAKQEGGAGEHEAEKEKRLKRPDWYGYAHTANGWYQLAGWAQAGQGRKEFIAGTTTRWEPDASRRAKAPGDDESRSSEAPSGPAERNPKARVRRGGAAKPEPQI